MSKDASMANDYHINFSMQELNKILSLVDKIDASKLVDREKIKVLINSNQYIEFISKVVDVQQRHVVRYLRELMLEKIFWDSIEKPLQNISELSAAGDLRFNSITLYLLVRALAPDVVIETGVAHGKSSAYQLAGLHANGKGKLISFDLPASGNVALDGSNTDLAGYEIGHFVPPYLRHLWELNIVDSLIGIEKISSVKNKRVLFFHDSLHTYDHAKYEIQLIRDRVSLIGIIMDNYDMDCGLALQEISDDAQKEIYICKDMGILLF